MKHDSARSLDILVLANCGRANLPGDALTFDECDFQFPGSAKSSADHSVLTFFHHHYLTYTVFFSL